MIAFACSQCGTRLRVPELFAGRQARCPTCKQPLAVPLPSATASAVLPQQLGGAESSLAQAGLTGGVTLDPDPRGQKPPTVPGLQPRRTVEDTLAQRQPTQRYVVEDEIARGGMGAILRAVDCDLRREVAVKYLLDDQDPKKKARFIEEAQINGQLEHPNIVPVYDLGLDPQQRPFILMKLVKGRSLKEVLDQLRDNPRQAEKDFSLGRLLHILVNVCHALAFAHARGVVHRDLKPANLMLGDFGEVYVMDWGLAKVLNQPEAVDQRAAPAQAVTAAAPHRNSPVVTNRAPEADLTQEGSVLGTPVYMPPEQALGHLQAIDQRSDVYALGAILYELLTLQPPVRKEGGHLGILMQVVQGEIIPPQQRDPKRTRAGQVPKELAAVALKALAKDKEDRYPTVDALRQDIERFQEGRSVSAQEDTLREALWRLVKRNKLASAFTTLLAVVLVWSSWTNFQARSAADKAQADKAKQAKEAVPSLTKAIKMMITEGDLEAALVQAKAAIEADPDHAEARLLKGQLLLGNQEFAAADQELTRCLQLRPDDAEARKLVELCRKTRSEDALSLFALAEELSRQKRYGLANRLTKIARGLVVSREQVLEHYRKQIKSAWPNFSNNLTVDEMGKLRLELSNKGIQELSPLKGIPLAFLNLRGNKEVHDLSPLLGMPLEELDCTDCLGVDDLTPLQGMKLTKLTLIHCAKLRDLSPLRGMPLTVFRLDGSIQVQDLSPLQNAPLTSLWLQHCGVRDLTPLKGMPLTRLGVFGCQVQDLSPLKGMPLTFVGFDSNRVKDLSPLQGMNLTEILFQPQHISKGMEVLRQMKSLTKIYNLAPDEFWKKYDAGEFK